MLLIKFSRLAALIWIQLFSAIVVSYIHNKDNKTTLGNYCTHIGISTKQKYMIFSFYAPFLSHFSSGLTWEMHLVSDGYGLLYSTIWYSDEYLCTYPNLFFAGAIVPTIMELYKKFFFIIYITLYICKFKIPFNQIVSQTPDFSFKCIPAVYIDDASNTLICIIYH